MNRRQPRPLPVQRPRQPARPPKPGARRGNLSRSNSRLDPVLCAALILLGPLVVLRVILSLMVGSYGLPWFIPPILFALFYIFCGYLAASSFQRQNPVVQAYRGRSPAREKGVAAAMTLCLLSWVGFVLASLILDVLLAGGLVIWDAPALACIGPLDFLAAMSLGYAGSAWVQRNTRS